MPEVGRQDREIMHSDRKGKGKKMAWGINRSKEGLSSSQPQVRSDGLIKAERHYYYRLLICKGLTVV